MEHNLSILENTEKEVKEEAGIDVKATRLVAVMDRDKHNLPRYLYKVINIFVLCQYVSGHFEENNETIKSQYFNINELPLLSLPKNNENQIKLCYEAYLDENWKTYFD